MSEIAPVVFTHARVLESVRSDARKVASHLVHDHPVMGKEKREQGTINVRKRSLFHAIPRLWHKQKMYVYFLELYQPLWLGTDGVIYREYVDWLGNSYLMEAEIWLRDTDGLHRITSAFHKLDPCCVKLDI